MSSSARILMALIAIFILFVVLKLSAQQRLRSRYALLWLSLAVPSVVLSLFPRALDWTAEQLGIENAPALLLTGACAVLLLIAIQYSWELSRLEERTRRLAEEVALLDERLRKVEHNKGIGDEGNIV